jgi:RNA polymerase sigma-70 factor (ECF subfamily)
MATVEMVRGRDSGFFPTARALRPTRASDGSKAPASDAGDVLPCSPHQSLDDDDALVAAMIRNEPRAWRAFQRRFDRLIHRCITKVTRRFTSIVTQDDVRDIYATLYLSLVANDRHKLRTFDPTRGNRFSSWIGLLAINCAYDYLRAIKREPNKGTLAEADDLACDMPDPFEHAVEAERARAAAKMLDGFSAKDRHFAALYFGEGMDPLEIASRMNISVKTVYSKKHKIQTRLESLTLKAAEAAEAETPPSSRAIIAA